MLEIQNLTCGYDGKEIIKEVSFSVRKGDFIGIIGPNGAGKTTLFRGLTGILRPFKGEVIYNNTPIRKIPLRQFACEAAIIPQFMEIPFGFTVEEFVFLGRFPHLGRFQSPRPEDFRITEEALVLTDTRQLRLKKIFELSGGERQRIILAQGFAQKPKLLLLDEPTAHLDITHQSWIMDILKKLNKEQGLTVVLTLHDLNLASEYCQRIILFNEGRIFRQGSPEDVLTYQNIESVYKTVVVVEKNPVSFKPYILLVPQEQRQANFRQKGGEKRHEP